MCLDEEALQKVLRLAYDKYLDWIEFVCMTEGNRKHEKIDAFSFELTYKLKKELAEEQKGKPSTRAQQHSQLQQALHCWRKTDPT
ncbi:unnamed protein product [Heligmosomoides polygyrus]|uniref:Uncharacterized protein n=1 Tax=Heligmosomoides polygyrus TaxID=6339 RepID=A0A183FCP1_HELPZ|nr:unnamed protein product [Heligmosomoides polygyrus]